MNQAIQSSLWPDSLLNQAKAEGDSLGESVIRDLLDHGNIASVNQLLSHLSQNKEGVPEGLPSSVSSYFEQTSILPSWTDASKVALAQKFFSMHGPSFGVVLLFKSLPILYAGSKGGAQVLNMTGQLTDHFRRRASETLRFILDAMELGGLEATGKGIRAIQKVRLMHAAIRMFASKSDKWPSDGSWGVPINQEELSGTLAAFSSEALLGLKQMGIDYTPEEEDAFLHIWKVIGHILGINPDYVPHSMHSATLFWKQLSKRNFAKTSAGLKLTEAHIEFMEEVVPGEIMDGVVPALMRFFMGRKIAESVLGVPSAGWSYWLVYVVQVVLRLRADLIGVNYKLDKLLSKDSVSLMESLQKYWAEGDTSMPFQIPKNLES